jgi:adhesin/invasin
VRVLSRNGKPLRGREVVFSTPSESGLVSGNVQITGKDGVARVGAWILGPAAGTQRLEARIEGLPPLFFSVAALAGDPATIKPQGWSEQVGVVGLPLDIAPSVIVKDLYGNPVPNRSVEFQILSGDGLLGDPSPETNAAGVASVGAWVMGRTPGKNAVSATLSELSPVIFRATADPDVPSHCAVLLGADQTGTVGTELPVKPTILVADRLGNPLEGVPVLFEVITGGGSIGEGLKTTQSSGAAVADPWVLGPPAGLQSLRITPEGLAPIELSATALPGPPAGALAQGGGPQSAVVGTDVPDSPTVLVVDAFGNPVPNVPVVFSASGSPDPKNSPGTVEGAETATDEQGLARVGKWTLGQKVGSYSVSASVAGLPEGVVFFATGIPAEAASLAIQEGDQQTVPIGTPVPIRPAVRVNDQYGNRVPGVTVVFSVVEGGGTLGNPEVVTDLEGVGALGSWTLGSTPGLNRISASVQGLNPVVFEATALSAPPAHITRTAGDGQTALVGTPVPINPQVRVTDASGNPVASAPVEFSVVMGGGSLTQGATITDSDGMASVGSWTLGQVAGQNRLSVRTGELQPALFIANGIPGSPAFLSVYDGNGQAGLAGTEVPLPPSVIVEDSFRNPVPGVQVGFSVSEGGGSLTGTPATTDNHGVARVGSWVLGPIPGQNRLLASVPGLSSVGFRATGFSPGAFQMVLEYQTAVTPSQEAVFEDAAARWEEIVVGDLPDFSGVLPIGGCQPVVEADGIDDVKVYITVEDIDGPGGILGQAGPCYYRTGGGAFPLTGVMRFDLADVNDLEASGLLDDVIVHEMGHVLGFGSLWNASSNAFLVGAGGADPYFNGAAAIAAFDAAGGAARTDPKVPVENTGGPGTRDGHWRESVHNSELMTGWIEAGGVTNPLSAITIASFADMGYVVNMGAADPYLLFDPLGAPPQGPPRRRIFIKELPPPTPIPVGSGAGAGGGGL